MGSHQLFPLEVNSKTGEPFLRLPIPFERIIITPLRESDKPDMIRNMRDERVIRWLAGPPHPYLQEHADQWTGKSKRVNDATLAELRNEETRNPGGPLKVVDHCPVGTIREVLPSGEEVFIGDCSFERCGFDEFTGEGHAAELAAELEQNSAKPTGDPTIVWCVGDYLAPSHQGHGIMSAVFSALLNSWAIPRMNARVFRVYTYASNRASCRVFEKNGFHLVKTIDDWKEVKGVKQGLNVLEWQAAGIEK